MNAEMTFAYGPVFLIAFTLQQIFLFYAIYIIFFKPDDKKTIRKRILEVLRNRLQQGEIDFNGYKKLERDFKNLEI
jgi:uncharacterized membrane protein